MTKKRGHGNHNKKGRNPHETRANSSNNASIIRRGEKRCKFCNHHKEVLRKSNQLVCSRCKREK